MLFSQPLLTINPFEMMKLWGELVECYYDVNGYGGNTAEIYAYRLMPYSPSVHNGAPMTDLKEQRSQELNAVAAGALASLCEEFEQQYECQIEIDGRSITSWYMSYRDSFDHRVHVEVKRT